jgi:hypothetical protein
MREAVAKDPGIVQPELGRELASLLMVIVNQIAARFQVYGGKVVSTLGFPCNNTLGSMPRKSPIRMIAIVPIPPVASPGDTRVPRRSSMFVLRSS